MNRILLLTLLALFSFRVCYSQNNDLGKPVLVEKQGGATGASFTKIGDGSGSFGQTFNRQNVCGLNYVEVSQIIETRTSTFSWNNNGTGFPGTLNLSGLCTTNDSVLKAYLYWGTSYFGSIANPAQLSITNPLSNTFTYNVNTIGLSVAKCWGETGTAAYREDVTNCISGNGSYIVNITGAGDSAYEVDGVTLLVIYRDPTATYSASLVIWDGIQTSSPGNPYLETFNGFNVCSASSAAKAFSILGDLQGNQNGGNNVETFNGTSQTFTNDFWNFNSISTSLTAGQNSIIYHTYTNDAGTDCYSWIMAGVYWQNTNCITCTPANSFVTISSLGATICAGDSIQLNGNGASGSYTWAPGGSLSCTSCSSTYAKPNITTTYTVSAGTLCGTGTDTLTIHVIPTPTITILPNNPGVCSGDSIQLMASGGTTYTWVPNTGLSCYNCPNPKASPTATTTYTVTSSNGGCTGTTSVTVSVGTPPSLVVNPTTATICAGNTVNITASGATFYNWSPSTGLSCNTCPNPIASPTATTTYTVLASNGGCKDTGKVLITVNPAPLLTYSPNSPTVCPGDSAQITVSGATSYQWLNSSGITCTNCPNPIVFPLVSTIYTVVGTGSNGCTDTLFITVNVNATLNVTAGPQSPTICAGSSIMLTGGGASVYNWKPATGLSCTGCPSPVASPTATITYTVTGSSGPNCEDSAFITVTILPSPSVVVTGPDSVCPGSSVTLTASGATSYTWSNSATTNAITIPSLSDDTSFTVVGFDGVCYDSVKKNISVYPVLSIVMSPSDSICSGSSIPIQVFVKGAPPLTYVWNNGITADSAGPFYVSPGSQTIYTCIVSDGCGNIVSGSTTITPVPKTSHAAFYASPDSILGGEFVNFINLSTGGNSYYWDLGDGSNSNLFDPFHQYNTPGVFTVYLVTSDGHGCPDTARENVYVTEGVISVPNVFTPNGDGVNDVLHITAGGLQSFDIIIYDRWGVKIFESLSPNIDWTGRSSSGIMQSEGTYYYIITAKDDSGRDYNLKGFVQLILK